MTTVHGIIKTDKMQHISKDSIEQAYCFLHQKWRVYEHSTLAWQKDDIEYAVAQYADAMSPALYGLLAGTRADFLTSHPSFAADMQSALSTLGRMGGSGAG